MKLSLVTLVFLTSTLSWADDHGQVDGAARASWDRALASATEAAGWVPGEVVMTMEFLNRKGEVDQTMKVLMTFTPTDEGVVEEVTILEEPGGLIGTFMPDDAMSPDGISGASRDDESGAGDPSLADPFAPEVQDSLRLELLGEPVELRGVACDAFAIGWVAPDETAYEGTIWLSRDTARPVRLDVAGESASDSIRSLTVVIEYQPDGVPALPKSMVSSLEFHFALVINVRFRMILEFANYFESDESI